VQKKQQSPCAKAEERALDCDNCQWEQYKKVMCYKILHYIALENYL